VLIKLRTNQKGVALTSVVIVAIIMATLVASTVALAVNSQDLSRRDQDWNAALAAAEAGMDDYLYRLNRIDAYWQYPKTGFPNGPDSNMAFTQWVPVPGAANDGRFRYYVDSSQLASAGVVKVASTGLVGTTTRTVYGTLKRRNFLDYLYFTDFETMDPALYEAPYNNDHDAAWAQTNCANKHYYDSPGRHSECVRIYFYGAGSNPDEIKGPLHSNDAYYTYGSPDFLGDTSTSWNRPPPRYLPTSGTPDFAVAGDPRYLSPLTIPPSNSSIKNYTNPLLGETGCLYTGPTRIVLNSGGSGSMTVTSPLTKNTNTGCGTGFASGSQTVAIPANGVVYVQGVPAVTSDPNYSNCNTITTYPLRSSFIPSGDRIPMTNDMTPYMNAPYGKCAGDTFIKGTLKGRLTVASANNIIVIDDTTYSNAANDILGLVADNFVEVYHPVECDDFDSYNPPGPPPAYNYCVDAHDLLSSTMDNIKIHAAILSVNHSFRVQNYRFGSQNGDLTVVGAIAQRYRGIVGQFGSNSTGYIKDYNYDQRLKYQSPPHFLDPVKSAWGIVTWVENKPCYRDGTSPVRTGAGYDDYCS
jgi:hypothetical protein